MEKSDMKQNFKEFQHNNSDILFKRCNTWDYNCTSSNKSITANIDVAKGAFYELFSHLFIMLISGNILPVR